MSLVFYVPAAVSIAWITVSWFGRACLDLIQDYKPLFENHSSEGLAIGDIRKEITEAGITSGARFEGILQRADVNNDQRITYAEFEKTMLEGRWTEAERDGFGKSLRTAMSRILPREDYFANITCCPPPWFIPTISLAQIIIFAVYAVELAEAGTPVTADTGVPLYSPLTYRPARRHEAWRFLTYMFIHMGWSHLVLNIVLQLVFGLALEILHTWRTIILYLLGVIAGSLAHSITDHNASLVGASGGVFALFGGQVANVIINWDEMNHKWRDNIQGRGTGCVDKTKGIARLLVSAPAMLIYVFVFVVPETSLAIYNRVTAPEDQKVGVAAHIGGFLCGLLLGVPLLKNVRVYFYERVLGWVFLAVYLICVVFAVLFNGFYKGYPPEDFS